MNEEADLGFDSSDSDMAEANIHPYDFSLYNKPVDEYLLNQIAPFVASHWKSLAIYLNLGYSVVKNIEEDYKKTEERCRESLVKWKQKSGDAATVLELAKALVKCERTDAAGRVTDTAFAQKLYRHEKETDSITLHFEGDGILSSPGFIKVKYAQDPVTGKRYIVIEEDETTCLQDLVSNCPKKENAMAARSNKLMVLKQKIEDICTHQRRCIKIQDEILASSLKAQGHELSNFYDSLSELCGQYAKSQDTACCDKNLIELQEKAKELEKMFNTISICELFFEGELNKFESLHSDETECQEILEVKDAKETRMDRRMLVQKQLLCLLGKPELVSTPVRHTTPAPASERLSMLDKLKRTFTENSPSVLEKLKVRSRKNMYLFNTDLIQSPLEGEDDWVSVKEAKSQNNNVVCTKVTGVQPLEHPCKSCEEQNTSL